MEWVGFLMFAVVVIVLLAGFPVAFCLAGTAFTAIPTAFSAHPPKLLNPGADIGTPQRPPAAGGCAPRRINWRQLRFWPHPTNAITASIGARR